MTRPLEGRRIVVTRSLEQAGPLAALLADHGATPVVVPLVRTEVVAKEAVRLAGLDLAAFDWLVVTSPNGARQVLAAQTSLAGCRIAAVGAATATVFGEGGRQVELIPVRQGGAQLVEAMPLGPGRLVLVQAEAAEPTVRVGLADKGWSVETVAPYTTRPVTPSTVERDAALSADALLLASGSAARSWAAVFGTQTPPVVVVIGPQTACAARSVGIGVTAESDDHSLNGLVTTLEGVMQSGGR